MLSALALLLHLIFAAELGKGRKRKGCSQLGKYAYPALQGSSKAAWPQPSNAETLTLPASARGYHFLAGTGLGQSWKGSQSPTGQGTHSCHSSQAVHCPGHCQARGRDANTGGWLVVLLPTSPAPLGDSSQWSAISPPTASQKRGLRCGRWLKVFEKVELPGGQSTSSFLQIPCPPCP